MSIRSKWLGCLVGAVLVALAAVQAQGQTQPPPAFVTFQLASWTAAPAIVGQTVKGFLCYYDPTLAVGQNITVVWYQREADNSWTTWAWGAYTPGEAALWVRARFNDATVLAEEPILHDLYENASGPISPKQVINGLFFDDPVQSVVVSADAPVELVTTLVDVGWAAAPNLSPLAVDDAASVCTDTSGDKVTILMDDLAHRAEIALFNAAEMPSPCQAPACDGCLTTYSGRVANPGAAWTFRFSVTRADGVVVCFYEKDAHSDWYETGKKWSPLCLDCTGSGSIACKIYRETSYTPPGSCQPPA